MTVAFANALPLWVDAPTVMTHGSPAAVELGPGPSFPDERATNTPLATAFRNAMSCGSLNAAAVPTEKLSTSTPSMTAASVAAALSEKKQLAPWSPPRSSKQGL